jgi:hypothetical protein
VARDDAVAFNSELIPEIVQRYMIFWYGLCHEVFAFLARENGDQGEAEGDPRRSGCCRGSSFLGLLFVLEKPVDVVE